MSGIKIERGIPIHKPESNPEAKIRDAAKMYEQYFLNEMVKSMRKTIDHSEMTEPTMAETIYSEQLDNQYVETWSNTGGVGLADIIYNQLQERFYNRGGAPVPQGPIPIQKGTTLKIDETQPSSIPVISPKSSLPKNELSFLYQWTEDQKPMQKNIQSPYDGKILQNYRVGEDRHIVKLAHDDGLVSTISYIGTSSDFKLGDQLEAGQKLGTLSPYALGLTWHLAQAET